MISYDAIRVRYKLPIVVGIMSSQHPTSICLQNVYYIIVPERRVEWYFGCLRLVCIHEYVLCTGAFWMPQVGTGRISNGDYFGKILKDELIDHEEFGHIETELNFWL